jgi:hypothetical protein
MIQPLRILLAAAIALFTASLCHADETFPVVHNEPVTVRIVSGKNGLPLSNLHLVLLGGYDQSDLHDQLYREEVLTDTFGNARLPKQLTNLPWLQVWVNKMPLCQSNPRKTSFSVELIRRDGLSAPNLCGPVSAQITPGVFTVFVKNKAKKLKKGVSISVAVPEDPVKNPPPVAQPQAPLVAAVAPVTPAPPAKAPAIATLSAPDAIPDAAFLSATVLPIFPTKTVVHLQSRRVVAKRSVHRAKPAPSACSAPPPTAKTASAPAKATPPKEPTSATHRSKPSAGLRVAAKKPAHPASPQKQE